VAAPPTGSAAPIRTPRWSTCRPRLLTEPGLLLRHPAQAAHPHDFEGLDELASQILAFENHYNAIARPFDWRFTRTDLNQLLARIRHHDRHAPHPLAE
jgi:hypothetical protein